jgi:RNA polymerase sigma-70 factor (ECF subfamily)
VARDRFQRLLADARAGDEAAWAEIFAELAPAVLGYLRGSAASDPENVLGDTFLQVARDVGEFDGDWGGFKAWVFTIAHHRLIDARRHSGRRPADLVAEVPEPTREPMPDAAEQAMERIGAEEVNEVLAVLSKDQRAVVLLRIIGDLSIEQCAEALGKRPGAIKQLQRRGLAAARKQLQRGVVTQ